MDPKHIRRNEDDKADTPSDLWHIAAAAVDGVAYVFFCVEFAYSSLRLESSVFIEIGKVLYNLEVAALDREIYIYGIDVFTSKPSFQVFDPVHETFKNLPWYSAADTDTGNALTLVGLDDGISRAVYDGNYLRLLGVDTDLKRIVFVSDHGLFFYNTQSGAWGSKMEIEIRSSLLNSSDRGWCVVVGKRIYWLADTKQMMAYDFGECAYYESKALAKFQGSFSTAGGGLEFGVFRASLLHINEDYFCLIWQSMFDSDFLITTLRVSSSTTNKSLTVSLLNTEKYSIDGYLELRLALRLQPKDPILMHDTMEDLEEFPESPIPPHHFDVPYSIVEHLSPVGDRFLSKVALSFWICGCTGEGEECFFPIDLRVSRPADSREVKRTRQDETLLEQICIVTDGLKGCVHVALDGKIYNFGGSSNGSRPENSINIIDIQNTMRIVSRRRMKRARYGPQVAELNKRIYIFGGEDYSITGGNNMESAEVFDVARGCCELLPDGFGRGYRLVGVDHRRERIMFLPAKCVWPLESSGYRSSYYYYDTCRKRWETETRCKINSYSQDIGYTNRVLVGTTLYWVSEAGFHSYDFEKCVSGKSEDHCRVDFYDLNFDYASMFHMYDDVFCLVILDEKCRYGTLYWIAVRISISDTVLLYHELHKIDVVVLHADLYTTQCHMYY
jgi:hypothetical protein